MKPALKTILSVGMLVFLALHFLLLLNYTAPRRLGGKAGAISQVYCYPYFHQQWTVFVPAPNMRFQLFVRSTQTNQKNWIPVVSGTMPNPERNQALIGNEMQSLIFDNAINYLVPDLGNANRVFLSRPQLTSFTILERAVYSYLYHAGSASGNAAYEILLLVTSPDQKPVAYYFKNLSR